MTRTPPNRQAWSLRLASLASIVVLWWLISLFSPPRFIPSPLVVLKEMARIIGSGSFLFHMYHTIARVFLGFLLAFVVSAGLGILMGIRRRAEQFFEVEILVGLTIPGLAWAMISLIWFGVTNWAAIFAIFIIILPMITVNMWEGTKALDRELIEMGLAFRASRRLIIQEVIIPQLLPYLFAATRFGFAMAWKVVVISEMLGLSNGIGYMINYSFGLFAMEGVLAWTIAFTMVMILLEFGLIKQAERRLTRWRPQWQL